MTTETAPRTQAYTIKSVTYRLPSASEPGVIRTVTEQPGRYTCDCPAGSRGRACWHVRAVLSDLVRPVIRVGPAPEPAASAGSASDLWND